MSFPQARLTDLSTCPCIPGSPTGTIITGANRTFVNNLPAAIVGSGVSCPSVAVTGSQTVFIENRPAHRQTDLNACGGTTLTGSPNTYVG